MTLFKLFNESEMSMNEIHLVMSKTGVGYAAMVNCAWMSTYYIVILAWILFYIIASLTNGRAGFSIKVATTSRYQKKIKRRVFESIYGIGLALSDVIRVLQPIGDRYMSSIFSCDAK